MNLLRLPEKALDALLSDSLLEDVGPALASVCGGDTRLIEELIEDPTVSELARGAGMMALVTLVKVRQRSREEVLEYFRHLFRTSQAEPGSYFWSGLVGYAAELYPDTLYEEIETVFARGLPDPFFITLEDVDVRLAEGKGATLKRLAESWEHRLIDDTIGETEHWASFQPQPVYTPRPLPGLPPSRPVSMGPRPGQFPEYLQRPAPVQRPAPAVVGPKPGRNDPCPCGSGQKYKKCCLKKAG